MSDINIGVDASQVVKAESALDGMEAAFGKLVAKIIREEKQLSAALKRPWEAQAKALDELIKKQTDSATTAARANQTIVNSLLGVTNQYKSAEASAETFVQSLRNQEAAAKAFGLSVAANAGVNKPAATQSGAGFGALEAEIERLSMKYNQVYASSQLYEKSLEELNAAHRLGVIGVSQYESAVEGLNAEFANFNAGTAGLNNRFVQFDNQMQSSQKGIKQFQLFAQQAGFQIGDFAVQVASGQSALVAFTQQATQLLGFIPRIGYWGAIAGAVLAVGGAFATYFMRANEAKEATDKLEEAIKALGESSKSIQIDLDKLLYDTDSSAQVSGLLERVRLQDELAAKTKEYLAIETEAITAATGRGFMEAALGGQRRQNLEELEASILKINEALAENKRLSNDLALTGLREQLDTQEYALSLINSSVDATEALAQAEYEIARAKLVTLQYSRGQTDAQRLATQEAIRFLDETRRATVQLESSKKQATNLANALSDGVDFISQIKSIANSISTINVSVRFQAAFEGFTGGAAEWASGIYSNMQTIAEGGDIMFNSPRPKSAPNDIDFGLPSGSSGGSGGGGGGGSDPNAGKLEALIQSLQTERETIDIWYEESKALLQASSDAELAIVGGKNAAMIRLEEELQEKLKGIKEAGSKSQLETYLSGGAEILGALGSFNDKALKISKAFAAAEALVSTYQGAAAELKKGTFGFATAAAVIAKGIGFVAAIKGINSGGTSSGSGGGSSGASTSTISTSAAETPQTVYIDSIDPEALYSGATLVNLFDAFYGENDRRGKVFIVGR